MTNPGGDRKPIYQKPPIIEAVIALHFATPLELKSIEAFARKRKVSFPRDEEMFEVSATFETQANRTASAMKKIGRKLSSSDGVRTIIILPAQFSVCQFAPYTDWDALYDEARQEWNVLAKIVKHRALRHVSARYINRIDIPVDTKGKVDLHKYFNIGLSLPLEAQNMALQNFSANCSLLHASGKYRYALNFAYTPPLLIDFMSFIVDIDVITTDIIPQNEEKIWELINSLRKPKNDLFESCITAETRKLFQ